MSRTPDILIYPEALRAQLASRGLDDQVPLRLDLDLAAPRERELDDLGVGTRPHHKIVFQLALRSVVNQAYARPDLAILDANIVGNFGARVGRIVAQKVVGLALHLQVALPSVGLDLEGHLGVCGLDL